MGRLTPSWSGGGALGSIMGDIWRSADSHDESSTTRSYCAESVERRLRSLIIWLEFTMSGSLVVLA